MDSVANRIRLRPVYLYYISARLIWVWFNSTALGIQSHCDMMIWGSNHTHSHHGSDYPQVIGSLGLIRKKTGCFNTIKLNVTDFIRTLH